jgi:hypothetical protein
LAVTVQHEIETVVREEKLGGKGKMKIKAVVSAPGARLNHVVEGEIDLG